MSTQPAPPQPSAEVVITLSQIYGEMQGLRQDVNTMKDVLNPAISDIRHDVADHETRIRNLETTSTTTDARGRVLYAIGGFAASGAIAVLTAWLSAH